MSDKINKSVFSDHLERVLIINLDDETDNEFSDIERDQINEVERDSKISIEVITKRKPLWQKSVWVKRKPFREHKPTLAVLMYQKIKKKYMKTSLNKNVK